VDSNQAKTSAQNHDISYLETNIGRINWLTPLIQDQVSTTNDLAKENFYQVIPGLGVVAIANEQTAGRGRLDRSWSTPAGSGIAMSIASHIDDWNLTPTVIPLVTGLAVHRALKSFAVQTELKWPNDIVVADSVLIKSADPVKPTDSQATENSDFRKLGGILVQLHGDKLIIGIGINVSIDKELLPTKQATSLSVEGFEINRDELIVKVLEEINFLRSENSQWLVEYSKICSTIGKQVRVIHNSKSKLDGKAISIDETGALLVENLEKIYQVTVGDIVHLQVLPN
jgi:BirA family biotin operon repressor/biotin-[acetyl-CoA-carboxylase] ligase